MGDDKKKDETIKEEEQENMILNIRAGAWLASHLPVPKITPLNRVSPSWKEKGEGRGRSTSHSVGYSTDMVTNYVHYRN